jgi:Fe2+ or Zn2+ uptake regulation protein
MPPSDPKMPDARTDDELDGELARLLRAAGHRVTLPRRLVHRHVRRTASHLTPEQVHAAVAPGHPSLSPATIYATLDLLDDLGVVGRVSTPRGHTVYDPRTEPHHHLVCRRCGRVEDVDGAVEAGEVEAAARAAGFRAERAEVQLSGLCRDCAA